VGVVVGEIPTLSEVRVAWVDKQCLVDTSDLDSAERAVIGLLGEAMLRAAQSRAELFAAWRRGDWQGQLAAEDRLDSALSDVRGLRAASGPVRP